MHFKEVPRVEYEHNILFQIVFQARFPEIMRISHEEPFEFQDIVRKEGYPESGSNIPNLPPDIPKELEEMVSADKVFHFFSEARDWKISLARNFIAFTCMGNYGNYTDFRERLEKVLQTFHNVYEPSYFTRIGLRYRDIANSIFLPHIKKEVEAFIPAHIFPELETDIAKDIAVLQKQSQFNDGDVRANVVHVLSNISGTFRQRRAGTFEQVRLDDVKSYVIDVDCFCENKTEGINDVITRCDTFKQLCWNIFQWSITDELRTAMGELGSSK